MAKLVIDVPEDVFSILRVSPEAFTQELRLAAAVKWYELGRISQDKAAELAGLTRTDFLRSLSRFEVSPFQVTTDELEAELSRE
jgi:predicted HTH domain antitoxin